MNFGKGRPPIMLKANTTNPKKKMKMVYGFKDLSATIAQPTNKPKKIVMIFNKSF
jgi:hypothetical protein